MENYWMTNTKKKVKKLTTKFVEQVMGKRNKRNKFKATKETSELVATRPTIEVKSLTPIPRIELNIKPDYTRLIQLLEMRTYSKDPIQDVFITRLENHFKELGASTYKDSYGNLYVTKGNAEIYPCVVAHTDINQQKRNNVKIIQAYPWMFGFDTDEAEQCGMGADDKVGVYFAVHMFDLFDNIKLFFPKDEEIGLVGTNRADKEFFTNCTMLVQLDRNSYKNDLITYTNGITVCSDEFVNAAKPIMDKYMYAKNNGSCTDIGGLKKYDTVNCVAMNVSCGYINEHSDSEMISMPHFENAINFGYELLCMGVDRVWSHTADLTMSYSYGGYGSYGSYGSYGGYGTYNRHKTNYDLFDDYYGSKLDTITENKDTYIVTSPNGNLLTLDLKDLEQDKYLYQTYEELTIAENRGSYLSSYNVYDPEGNEHDQYYIDDCLSDGMCPCCYDKLRINNRLLIYLDCNTCGSQWNYPTDYEGLTQEEFKPVKY